MIDSQFLEAAFTTAATPTNVAFSIAWFANE
jgi:hypothetical protein